MTQEDKERIEKVANLEYPGTVHSYQPFYRDAFKRGATYENPIAFNEGIEAAIKLNQTIGIRSGTLAHRHIVNELEKLKKPI